MVTRPEAGQDLGGQHEIIQRRPRISYGTTLFAAGPPFWDPSSPHPTGEALHRAISQRYPVDINQQWYLVDGISNVQRQSGDKELTQQQIDTWIGNEVVPLFEGLHKSTSEEARTLRHIFWSNFGINLERDNIQNYTQAGHKLWKRYFQGGSKAGLFIADLTRGLQRADPTDRLQLAEPFLYLFGGEETVALIKDAARAEHYILYSKSLLMEGAEDMRDYDFSSDGHKRAYTMAWDLYRDGGMAADRQRRQNALTTFRSRSAPRLPSQPEPRTQPRHEELLGELTTPIHGQPQPVPIVKLQPDGAQENHVTPEAQQPEFVVAGKVIGSPEHPTKSADRVVALPTPEGGFLLSAIDGMGSGEEYSEAPAGYLQRALVERSRQLTHLPTVEEGRQLLLDAFTQAAAQTARYKGYVAERYNPPHDVLDNIGAVATAGILCKKDETTRTLTLLNMGDARTILYYPDERRVEHVTVDHSAVQRLVREGGWTPNQAFLSPTRSVIYKSVTLDDLGRIDAKREMGQKVDEFSEVDLPHDKKVLVISMTDGFTDNMPPDLEVDDLHRVYIAQQGAVNPAEFASQLLTIIQQRMHDSKVQGREPVYHGERYAKADDAGIAVAYYSGE